jgi:cytochrome oxidase assembly protein ShyY1
MDPARHLGYAVQWFGLALTVAVIYGVLIFRNRKKSS